MNTSLSLDLTSILRQLSDRYPIFEALALIQVDGSVIASILSENADEGMIAAMASATLNIGRRVLEEFARGDLDQVIVAGGGGNVLLKVIKKDTMLATITKPDQNLGLILVELERTSNEIESLLTK